MVQRRDLIEHLGKVVAPSCANGTGIIGGNGVPHGAMFGPNPVKTALLWQGQGALADDLGAAVDAIAFGRSAIRPIST